MEWYIVNTFSGYESSVKRNLEEMPFDMKEYLEFEVPGGDVDFDWGK